LKRDKGTRRVSDRSSTHEKGDNEVDRLEEDFVAVGNEVTRLEMVGDVEDVLEKLEIDGVCTGVEDDVTVDAPGTPETLVECVEFPSFLDPSLKRHRL